MPQQQPKLRFKQAHAAENERWVVLYDGACAMCDASVQFIHRQDTLRQFFFAPLGGQFANRVLTEHPELQGLDTVIFVREFAAVSDLAGRTDVKVRSDAILQISTRLGGRFWWLSLCRAVPRFLRDAVYRLIAMNRRRIARNRGNKCMIPTPAFRAQCLP